MDNNQVSSSQACQLLVKQLSVWKLAEDNYRALANVKTRSFDMGGFLITVQFNPGRIISSSANVTPQSIKERKCFLCASNLPPEQEKIDCENGYHILCNPYPIFPQHFTIPTKSHTDQSIAGRFGDFLDLTRCLSGFTLFYNGPQSGASLPDHAHFQAVTPYLMPLDKELAGKVADSCRPLEQRPSGSLSVLTGYLRNGFVIKSKDPKVASDLFFKVYNGLDKQPDEVEPMMNLFGYHRDSEWIVLVFPRRQHRPWQYAAEGKDRLLSSPGAADIGGLFITPREEDFEKMTPGLLRDIYAQVCLDDNEVNRIAANL